MSVLTFAPTAPIIPGTRSAISGFLGGAAASLMGNYFPRLPDGALAGLAPPNLETGLAGGSATALGASSCCSIYKGGGKVWGVSWLLLTAVWNLLAGFIASAWLTTIFPSSCLFIPAVGTNNYLSSSFYSSRARVSPSSCYCALSIYSCNFFFLSSSTLFFQF